MNCSCKLASLCCFLLVPLAASFSRAANDDAPAADKSLPGLIARFREPKAEWEIDRIDAVPRLFGKATDAAHYALPATGGLISWTGLLVVPSDGQFVFTARTNSLDSLSIRINGKSATLGQPIALQAGLAPLEIEGTQKKAGPIGLELWWRGPGFDDEPIAPRFFRHNAPAPQDPAASALKLGERLDHGAVLADLYGCFGCHAGPKDWTASMAEGLPANAELLPGPRLNDVGSRLQPQWILQRLTARQPEAGSRMPVLFSSSDADQLAARTIAAYLSSPSPAASASPLTRGTVSGKAIAAGGNQAGLHSVQPKRPAADAQHIAHGQSLYKASGCAACHDAPTDAATDAAITSTVPLLDGLAAKWTRGGLVSFLQHPLETRPHGRMPDFNLSETDATDLADYLLALPRAGNPSAEPPLTVTAKELAEQWHAMGGADGAWSKMSADERRSAVALRQMTAHRCFSCHEFEARSTVSKEAHVEARNPATLADKRLDEVLSGCLAAGGPPKDVVLFALTAEERAAHCRLCRFVEFTCLGIVGRTAADRYGRDELRAMPRKRRQWRQIAGIAAGRTGGCALYHRRRR